MIGGQPYPSGNFNRMTFIYCCWHQDGNQRTLDINLRQWYCRVRSTIIMQSGNQDSFTMPQQGTMDRGNVVGDTYGNLMFGLPSPNWLHPTRVGPRLKRMSLKIFMDDTAEPSSDPSAKTWRQHWCRHRCYSQQAGRILARQHPKCFSWTDLKDVSEQRACWPNRVGRGGN